MGQPTDPQAIYNMMMAVTNYKEKLQSNIQCIRNAYSQCDSILGNDVIQYKHVSKLTDVIKELTRAYNMADDLEGELKEEYIKASDIVTL